MRWKVVIHCLKETPLSRQLIKWTPDKLGILQGKVND